MNRAVRFQGTRGPEFGVVDAIARLRNDNFPIGNTFDLDMEKLAIENCMRTNVVRSAFTC